MFWAKIRKNIKIFLMKLSVFKAEKKICLLHGQVFMMIRRYALNLNDTFKYFSKHVTRFNFCIISSLTDYQNMIIMNRC